MATILDISGLEGEEIPHTAYFCSLRFPKIVSQPFSHAMPLNSFISLSLSGICLPVHTHISLFSIHQHKTHCLQKFVMIILERQSISEVSKMKMRKQLHNKHYNFIRKWKSLYPNCRKVNCRSMEGYK